MSDVMTRLQLDDEAFPAVLSGDKKCTLCQGRRSVTLGPFLLVARKDKSLSAAVRVTRVVHCLADDLPTISVWDDGFDNHEHMVEEMRRFHPTFSLDDEVTFIEFELGKGLSVG